MSVKTLIISLTLLIATPSFAQTQSLRDRHEKRHQELLANSKSQIDKTVIQEYFRLELEGREGSSDKLIEAEEMIIDLLNEARSHMGKRYRSGGKGPNSFDCSGFAGYVFKQFGYELGASSRDQFTQGETIEKNMLKPGDLVFFTGRNSNTGRIGHVGIVVSADNEKGTFSFIHASTSGGIKIDNNSGYYGKRFVGAKRIIF